MLPEARPEAPEPQTLSLLSPENGLMRYLPKEVQNALMDLPESVHGYFLMSEEELLSAFKAEGYTPGPMENALRLKFWMEFDYTCTDGGKVIDMKKVCAGICPAWFFHKKIVAFPKMLAWVLCRPMEYKMKVKETLDLGLRRMRQILDMVPGPKDVRLMDLQAKITKMMDERDQGGIIQRVEQKTQSVQMVTTEKVVSHVIDETSMEALERRLTELKKREVITANQIAQISRPEKTVEAALEQPEPVVPVPVEKPLPPEPGYAEEIA